MKFLLNETKQLSVNQPIWRKKNEAKWILYFSTNFQKLSSFTYATQINIYSSAHFAH